jgi:putative component of toxin-antitoxin plasmid stabilization module
METTFEVLIYETSNRREPFNDWLDSLDNSVRGFIIARIDRLRKGQFGNSKAL